MSIAPPPQDEGRRAERPAAQRDGLPRQGSLRWSFTWAFEGIVYVLRTQRNMQIHVAAGAAVLILALVLDAGRLELVAVLGAVSLVIVAEMINTALEAALWAFHDAVDFGEAVLRAVNLGDDADTTGAVCGQLAGACFGESGIPQEWREGLAGRAIIDPILARLVSLD